MKHTYLIIMLLLLREGQEYFEPVVPHYLARMSKPIYGSGRDKLLR